MRVGVVLNPHSRQNRRRPGRAAALRAILGEHGEVWETGGLDELGRAVEALVAAGTDLFVSTGGDGALHWLLNEHVRVTGAPCALATTRAGTIDFVARKVGVHGEAESIVAELAGLAAAGRMPELVRLDSLLVEGEVRGPDGPRALRCVGFAAAIGGVGQRFFDQFYALEDPPGVAVAGVVLRAAASHLADRTGLPLPARVVAPGRAIFRPTTARVTIDAEVLPTSEHGAIHAGAFDLALGPLRVFPLARAPGRLHFQAGDITPMQAIASVPALFRGGLIRSDRLHEVQGSEMVVEALGDERLSPVIDGEIVPDVTRLTIRRGPPVPVARVGARAFPRRRLRRILSR